MQRAQQCPLQRLRTRHLRTLRGGTLWRESMKVTNSWEVPITRGGRSFARFVDTCTFGLLAGFALVVGLVLLLPEKAGGLFSALDNPFIGGPITLALWIPIEAVLLSTVGNTPARRIFGISVRTPSGHKPSFGQALMRSFGVCVQGVGLGIPFIAFFTQFFAYRRLTRTGTTLWDSSTGCVVTHKTWGTGRTVVCVVVVLFVVVLLSVLNAGSK